MTREVNDGSGSSFAGTCDLRTTPIDEIPEEPLPENKNIDLGPPRPPLVPQTKDELDEFKAALANAGFLPSSEL